MIMTKDAGMKIQRTVARQNIPRPQPPYAQHSIPCAVRRVPWSLRPPPSSYKKLREVEPERADHAWTVGMTWNGRIYSSEEQHQGKQPL